MQNEILLSFKKEQNHVIFKKRDISVDNCIKQIKLNKLFSIVVPEFFIVTKITHVYIQ